MKISLAQINFHIGNFQSNVSKIKQAIQKAYAEKADIIVFPELAICGYPPRDFLEFSDFIQKSYDAINEIAQFNPKIGVIVGGPARNTSGKGKSLFNAAFFLYDGKIQQTFHKSLLPTYDIFDEYRYFEPNNSFELLEFKGRKIAVNICEDLWNIDDNPLYRMDPMQELAKLEPEFIINIAASPFNYNQSEKRRDILSRNALKYKMPIFYVNHIGAQTELIFDGDSAIYNAEGQRVAGLKMFEEDQLSMALEEVSIAEPLKDEPNHKIALIHHALVLGIQNYFQKLGFKKAILGLSGGIDSAVTLALAVEALGSENVLSIMLPSEFSSDHSIGDSEAMLANLKCPAETIPIKNNYHSLLQSLDPYFKDLPFNIAEENLQARIRGVILMAFSNKFGHILLNTSNKSEAAVGYGTLYGDMNGGLSVLGDVYKTDVFALAKYINRNQEIIPVNIINKPPSAELRPDQKDSDSLPDYEILDSILFHYIEERKGPDEIINMGFDASLVRKVLRMVNMNEHKRYQTPPILRISSKAFGQGRRIPIVAKYLS